MVKFIKEHRHRYGVESICKHLPIAPSTFYEHLRKQRCPELRSKRAIQEQWLCEQIQRIWQDSQCNYGARKIWHQLKREGHIVARCTVERLMRKMDISGVVRGKKPRTTTVNTQQKRPEDLVKRQFQAKAPNQLWVADITYVATWTGFVYVAFVTDVYSRRIVGWRVSTSLETQLALDALEQALHQRKTDESLVHHSDRGSQYLSIRYSKRLEEAGIQASVGSVGSSYDNALAESINGLYKTEVIRKQGPWKGPQAVELATLKWVHWFNHHRLLGPIGYVPPAEFEHAFYQRQHHPFLAA